MHGTTCQNLVYGVYQNCHTRVERNSERSCSTVSSWKRGASYGKPSSRRRYFGAETWWQAYTNIGHYLNNLIAKLMMLRRFSINITSAIALAPQPENTEESLKPLRKATISSLLVTDNSKVKFPTQIEESKGNHKLTTEKSLLKIPYTIVTIMPKKTTIRMS